MLGALGCRRDRVCLLASGIRATSGPLARTGLGCGGVLPPFVPCEFGGSSKRSSAVRPLTLERPLARVLPFVHCKVAGLSTRILTPWPVTCEWLVAGMADKVRCKMTRIGALILTSLPTALERTFGRHGNATEEVTIQQDVD